MYAGYTRDSPVYEGYTRDSPVYVGYTRDSPVYVGYTRDSPVYAGYTRDSPVYVGYTRDSPMQTTMGKVIFLQITPQNSVKIGFSENICKGYLIFVTENLYLPPANMQTSTDKYFCQQKF